jgi:putative nucleotidyltransferase with HDIG domain
VLDTYNIDDEQTENNLHVFNNLFDALSVDPPQIFGNELLASLDEKELSALLPLFDSSDKRNFVLTELESQLRLGVVSAEDKRAAEAQNVQIIIQQESGKSRAAVSSFPSPRELADRLTSKFSEAFHLQQPQTELESAAFLLARLIQPNLVYNVPLTQAERRVARSAVPPIHKTVPRGEILIHRGSRVQLDDLEKVKSHEAALQETSDSYTHALGIIRVLLLAFVVIVVSALYLHQANPSHFTNRAILFTAALIGTNILLNRVVQEGLSHLMGGTLPLAYVSAAIPTAFTSVMLALLYGFRPAMGTALFFSILWAVMSPDPMRAFLIGLTASAAGAWALRKVRTRKQTFRAPLLMAFAVLTVEGIHWFARSSPPHVYLVIAIIALATAFGIVILANLLLPMAEWFTGTTTDISLLELSDLNHKLLKRLQLEAPGTYHHTQMVATLAEHAAEAVGANPLLARVAAYFHDIGKLYNPSYFAENSAEMNRHEHLRPRMSALVIINHVKEGLKLAARHKLRQPLREAIATHHGTSVVACFYHSACQEADERGEEVTIDEFRYPGPLPRGKEVSIISLVDACEAASRSLEKPTPKKIDNMVAEIFRTRISDGQLNESELTLEEIRTVEMTTKRTLCTMLHGRIAYPKDTENGSILLEPSASDSAKLDTDRVSSSSDDGESGSGARLVS